MTHTSQMGKDLIICVCEFYCNYHSFVIVLVVVHGGGGAEEGGNMYNIYTTLQINYSILSANRILYGETISNESVVTRDNTIKSQIFNSGN